MDGTHIRTNIKTKIIRSGLKDLNIEAWKKVAVSQKTKLSLAMLTIQDNGKIMLQQSDPFVRTMFAEDVERCLNENGDISESKFCKLFREWHEAEDMAGIGAMERCNRALSLLQWLLQDYNFNRFPPPTMYVKDIPRVTFEGLVSSIDAHVLLYAIVKGGTYNWQSVSTLVAENFMGELAECARSNNGVPNVGTMLNNDMGKISQIHGMRMNPNRQFCMQTSKARCYEVQETTKRETENMQRVGFEEIAETICISEILVKDHTFDTLKPKAGKKGKISGHRQIPKGVQPVRTHYKVDESKILPSLRMGIVENELPTA